MNFSVNQVQTAKTIQTYFSEKGWSSNAIFALLGNIQQECSMNPQESDSGAYGIVQWTPASDLINWCNNNGLNYTNVLNQCKLLENEVVEGYNGQYFINPHYNYELSGSEYSTSNLSISYLTAAFMHNYERPNAQYADLSYRISYAQEWAQALGESSASTENGWKEIDYTWYYYVNGIMQTGWQEVNSLWYYLNAQGVMQTGWQKVNSLWYYLNAQGVMQTGWQEVNSLWYYLNSNGIMQTGWQEVNSLWYYLNAQGVMQTGWQETNGKYYYLDPNNGGAMVTGTLEINGKLYTFSSGGAMESSTSGNQTTYTVQPGDTLSGIALKYDVTVAQLQAWNQISNPNEISIGQVLTV